MSAKRFILVGSLLLGAVSACAAQSTPAETPPATQPAEDLPSAEAVLERFVEVTGGREAWERIESRRMTGTLDFVGMGVKAEITAIEAPGQRMLVILDIAGAGKVEEGCDGAVAWTRSLMNGPHIAEDEEKAFRLRMATFNEHLHWREMFTEVACVGTEMVDDKPCYKLVLTPPVGQPDTCYYDQETGLRVRWDFSLPSPMGVIPVQIYQGDYREVDGVRIPHRTVQHILGQKRVLTFTNVEQNIDLPDGCFELPNDIAALRKKCQRQTVITETTDGETPSDAPPAPRPH